MCEIPNNVRIGKDLINYVELSICNDTVSDATFCWHFNRRQTRFCIVASQVVTAPPGPPFPGPGIGVRVRVRRTPGMADRNPPSSPQLGCVCNSITSSLRGTADILATSQGVRVNTTSALSALSASN